MLDIITDSKRNIKEHLKRINKKASRKINVISNYTLHESPQFNYFPLVWKCHNRAINNKSNHLRKRCLHIVCNDNNSSFQELQDKDKSVAIYLNNPRALAAKIFKVSNNYSTSLISEIFYELNNVYRFQNPSEFIRGIAVY